MTVCLYNSLPIKHFFRLTREFLETLQILSIFQFSSNVCVISGLGRVKTVQDRELRLG